ncbi:hypothetical protein GWK47_032472 [Chionoecetes opilio]|uniref:Uncharacterized protein n=1 Tax=Chionoecetes opilio TaxID=41210 RepID=A0A8J4YKB6_CHIOP|nr:hypothetical protein GWK47_032472 [Chionoecetes opilio]
MDACHPGMDVLSTLLFTSIVKFQRVNSQFLHKHGVLPRVVKCLRCDNACSICQDMTASPINFFMHIAKLNLPKATSIIQPPNSVIDEPTGGAKQQEGEMTLGGLVFQHRSGVCSPPPDRRLAFAAHHCPTTLTRPLSNPAFTYSPAQLPRFLNLLHHGKPPGYKFQWNNNGWLKIHKEVINKSAHRECRRGGAKIVFFAYSTVATAACWFENLFEVFPDFPQCGRRQCLMMIPALNADIKMVLLQPDSESGEGIINVSTGNI